MIFLQFLSLTPRQEPHLVRLRRLHTPHDWTVRQPISLARLLQVERAQYRREEHVQLNSGQRLAQTPPLAQTERDHLGAGDEPALGVQVAVRVELVGVGEVFGVAVYPADIRDELKVYSCFFFS